MGNDKHRNHVVSQFYLEQWIDNKGVLNSFIPSVKQYKTLHSTERVGFIQDTYTEEIEDCFGDIENSISDSFKNAVLKLENTKRNPLSPLPVLTVDETYAIYTFFYIQAIRTVKGRSHLLHSAENGNIHYLSDKEAAELAESQNEALLHELQTFDNKRLDRGLADCCIQVFRSKEPYYFWTSTSPVCYSLFSEMCKPDYMLHFGHKFDTGYMPLSPTLELIITASHDESLSILPHNKLVVMPMDKYYDKNKSSHERRKYTIDMLHKMNFSLLQGQEPQMKKVNGEICSDHRDNVYSIISKKFSKWDKDVLSRLICEHRDENGNLKYIT